MLNEIILALWIDALMDVLEDNLIKFAEQTNVSPAEMYETIEGRLKQTMDKVWTLKGRKAEELFKEENDVE